MANLGKAPGLDESTPYGWEHVADLLEGRESKPLQGRLGQASFARPGAPPLDARGRVLPVR